jgi:hypothetical protein
MYWFSSRGGLSARDVEERWVEFGANAFRRSDRAGRQDVWGFTG